MNESGSVFLFVILLLVMAACNPAFVSDGTSPSATFDAYEALPLPTEVHATEVLATATIVPPTAVSVTTTAIAPTPTTGPLVPFAGLQMVGPMDGWAWGRTEDLSEHLWRTSDGGLTWIEVTPTRMEGFGYALDPRNAWTTVCGLSEQRCGLAQTSDGGETWTVVNDTQRRIFDYRFHFFNEIEGLMQASGAAAGSAYLKLRETQDGGVTWRLVQVASYPASMQPGPAGEFVICNCGDALYIDSERLLVVNGNLARIPDEEIQLSITTDRGQTWHIARLALPPGQFSRGWFNPHAPVFYGDRDGILPVKLSTEDRIHSAMAFYVTTDGGLNWTFQSLVENVGNVEGESQLEFVSRQDMYFPCGNNLCASRDGALTWQTLSSNLNFGYSESEAYVRSFDFGDSMTGWALVGQSGEAHTLWRTIDGGKTWTILAPVLSP